VVGGGREGGRGEGEGGKKGELRSRRRTYVPTSDRDMKEERQRTRQQQTHLSESSRWFELHPIPINRIPPNPETKVSSLSLHSIRDASSSSSSFPSIPSPPLLSSPLPPPSFSSDRQKKTHQYTKHNDTPQHSAFEAEQLHLLARCSVRPFERNRNAKQGEEVEGSGETRVSVSGGLEVSHEVHSPGWGFSARGIASPGGGEEEREEKRCERERGNEKTHSFAC